MSSGGIALSAMEFLTYRVIDADLHVEPLTALLFARSEEDTQWQVRVTLCDITVDNGIYIVPVHVGMRLLKLREFEEKQEAEPYVTTNVTVAGVFRFSQGNDWSDALRDKMLRNQAPAIVFPFVRATIGTLLNNAGFGSVVVPLMNMNTIAENHPPVNIIDAVTN